MKKSVFLSFCAIAAAVIPHVEAQSPLNPNASRAVGSPFLTVRGHNPNVAEGREFLTPQGLAIDTTSTPPALYVADTGNNRVLVWKNASTFSNGQPADFVIGQLDKYSTDLSGPAAGRSTGLSSPVALAVDSKGNLYVADAGDNRILRYPKPIANNDDFKTPDMVIGQTTLNTNAPNNGGLSEKTIAIGVSGIGPARTAMVFDKDGNLWFSDSFNNRVLRYPVGALNSGANAPAADVVLGQINFTTNNAPPLGDSIQVNAARLNKTTFPILYQPSGLALDPAGRMFVCDSLARCVVFAGQLVTGAQVSRIMGINVQVAGQVNPPPVTEFTLNSPEGIIMIGNNPVVFDFSLNRIVRYDAYDNWPAETPLPTGTVSPGFTVTLSPAAKQVIGQADFVSLKANRGLGDATEASLSGPVAGAMSGTDMFVADSSNHRVLVFPTQGNGSGASRVLGQDNFAAYSPNLTEGKEFFLYNGVQSQNNTTGDFSDGGGIAVDYKSPIPRLYVADTYNNRVLGFKDARAIRPGNKADIVIGQADFSRSVINAPQGVGTLPMDVGLFRPSGLAVDANGALWVCDSQNGRVLRYPHPFDTTGQQRPDLVLGQSGVFAGKIADATRNNMSFPTSIAFAADGSVLVSDALLNRVLLFRKPAGGDFTIGQGADRVIGQPDFNTGARGVGANRFASPRGISTDSDDRLYVADPGNNRVVIYDRITQAPNDPIPAKFLFGMSNAQGIFVSQLTGEIWVADTRGNRAIRYPRFDRQVTNDAPEYGIGISVPLAVAQDGFGNLYVVEGGNQRVAVFYNGLATTNAASGNDLRLAPGMIASVFPQSPTVPFGDQTVSAPSVPWPTDLGDIQVLVNDAPTPVYFVSPGQINFLVPMAIPTSGTAEFQVVRKSTGQILASGNAPLDRVSPALFTFSGASGQVAALNEDSSVNGPTNMSSRGKVVTLYGTGGGFVTGAPPDGSAATGAINTDVQPPVVRVLIGTEFVPDANVLYSGLAPGLPGVWQINVKIPDTVAPNPQTLVNVQVYSVNSNQGKGGTRLNTTIAVKQ